MRRFQRLVLLILVVAALAALLVTPVFAADSTVLQPEPTVQPVVITDVNSGAVQFGGGEMPQYEEVKVEVQIPGNIYIGCSSYNPTDTDDCMQRFCRAQQAGEAVIEGGVYRCVREFTPQSTTKRN